MSTQGAAVAVLGSAAAESCPESGQERIVTPMLALTDDGPVLLGLMVACAHCGPSFRCAFCIAVLDNDGVLIYEHVTRHGPSGG